MNILIIGDSLSYPRLHKDQLIADSWPRKLFEKTSAYIWNRSIPGATSATLIKDLDCLGFYCSKFSNNFDAAIVQVGIVDATPRDFSLLLQRILNKVPFLFRNYVANALSYFKKVLGFKSSPWVSVAQFRENIISIIAALSGMTKSVVFIKIAPPQHYLCSNVPGVFKSVMLYNKVLDDVQGYSLGGTQVYILSPWDSLSHERLASMILSDGHHLSAEGHVFLGEKIGDLIDSITS